MVEGLEKGEKVKPQTLDAINEILRVQSGYTEIAPTNEGSAKRFRADFKELSEIFLPVAEAAVNLLCYGELAYLKKCGNSECILHFYDTSKSHRRRWCSMAGYGNRAKQAKFYSRDKFLDKADSEVAEIARLLNTKADDFRAVRLVSHHFRLLGLLHQNASDDWIILVDYDDSK